jgi:serine-type D-Ala-D-Ala carboxypeptidase/endopeptidase (penicillin-binding protein 4)
MYTTVDFDVQKPAATDPFRLRSCLVDTPAEGPGQGDMTAMVSLAPTGEELWSVEPDRLVVPASVLKLVTAQAALTVLGPDFRFRTEIVEGTQPGEWWLVGGGDPTLSRTGRNEATYYRDPARLIDLAEGLRSAGGDGLEGLPVTRLGIDQSRYSAFSEWDSTWRPNAWRLGFVAPVSALMTDGARLEPSQRIGVRSSDPVGQTTDAFIEALATVTGSRPVETVRGSAPSGARVVASVESPALPTLIDQMIRDSDNQIAEALIREVALALDTTSVDEALRAGLPDSPELVSGFVGVDGSGLSTTNIMSARLAVAVMAQAIESKWSEILVSGLARPGQPGSLLQRFRGLPEEVTESIRGKTGSLEQVRSLAGVIDGEQRLVFAVFISGESVDDRARDLIDSLVAQFHSCGENLAPHAPQRAGE